MVEAYQVLARKWRPQLFSELAGLEHIARTLQNAISRGRVGHAFMFTGSRGVGKTSAARVLAKALNCVKGPAVEPCNQCENCVAVTAGNSADVIEIDGASNRGVGEIRLLRDNVSYLPQSSPYKIYIIDEVHMLTTEAFNALLKTLEEPPKHVKFIMATTDVHKVPMTILSRCQRFDFGRLTAATIANALTEIATREDLAFAPGASELLAREAQGSMRDALSLLDQVRSYAGETISIDDLRSALGLIEARHSFTLLEKVVTGDLKAAVTLVNDLEQAGVDLKKFSEEFLFYLRDALFLKLSGELKGLLGISADEIVRLEPLVQAGTLPYWQQLFDLWQQHYAQIKVSQTPRLALEMALIELGMARDLLPLEELLERIERHLKVAPALVGVSPAAEPRKESAKIVSGKPVEVVKVAAPAPASRPAQPSSSKSETSTPLAGYPREEAAVVKPVIAESIPVDENYGFAEMPPQAPPPDGYGEASYADVDKALQSARDSSEKVHSAKPESGPAAAKQVLEVAPDQAQWAAFLVFLAGKDARLGAMLLRSRRQSAATGSLMVEVAPHALTLLDQDSVKQNILSLWAEFVGRNDNPVLQFCAASATPGGAASVRNGVSVNSSRQRTLPSKEEIFNDPAVRFISDRFGGRVTEIKARK